MNHIIDLDRERRYKEAEKLLNRALELLDTAYEAHLRATHKLATAV